jgi:hypothetical protein
MIAYICHGMTGRTGEELIKESLHALEVCQHYGITPLDPVIEEAVKLNSTKLQSANDVLPKLWSKDKEMIRRAHVLIDITASKKSEGCSHELGYARYNLWKPVIRVSKEYARNQNISIANLEDDLIVASVEQAAYFAQLRWGTFTKRLVWRVKMLLRCVPKWLLYQLQEIK